ncbi:DDE family transposase [Humitalea rosea]|uniref:DDE family transposase n=1 Tax=Humitalea rosea TaxID=990373 RepID=A0A2W7I5H0_9PROT|nr:transposase family protein [Humitalea rosea]PZW40415.1 DDE family transposase [Humitalea rosea]
MADVCGQRSLIGHFSALDEPRQPGKVLYPLPEIMLLVLCATLSGAEDFVEVRFWGREKLPLACRPGPSRTSPEHTPISAW